MYILLNLFLIVLIYIKTFVCTINGIEIFSSISGIIVFVGMHQSIGRDLWKIERNIVP